MKEKHVIHVLRQQDWNLTAAMKKTMRRNIGSFSAPPLWIPQLQQPDACGWRKATTLQCFIHMRHSIRELLLFLLLHALSLSLSPCVCAVPGQRGADFFHSNMCITPVSGNTFSCIIWLLSLSWLNLFFFQCNWDMHTRANEGFS